MHLLPSMKDIFLITILLVISIASYSQILTGQEVVKKSIMYHDPANHWGTLHAVLDFKETRPDGNDRNTLAEIENVNDYFNLVSFTEMHALCYIYNKGLCTNMLDFYEEISEEEIEKFKLNCKQTILLKNYYTYLWGMPMKLCDKGTIIEESVMQETFNRKESLVVKVNYKPEVGTDTWYFYFDPQTYALTGYRFYHDESQNDGEYITLDGILTVGLLKIHKSRKWFVNKDNMFMGEDIPENVLILN